MKKSTLRLRRRSGISQTVEMLSIIGVVVVAVSGLYAAATGLIGGLGKTTSLTVASGQLSVGTNSAVLSFVVQNSGNQPITGAQSVTLNLGANALAAATATGSGTGAWSCVSTTSSPSIACTLATSQTFNPGSQVTLSVTIPSTTFVFTTGNSYTITGTVGTQIISAYKLVAS